MAGGIKQKQYNHLRQIFLHSYGHEHLVTFANLADMGLLKVEEKPNIFGRVRKRLNVVAADSTPHRDTTYVHYGSAPPSVHLIRSIVDPAEEQPLEDLNKLFGWQCIRLGNGRCSDLKKTGKLEHLVVFLGGVTCSELAGLRAVANQAGCTLVVATTSVVNGDQFISEAMVSK